MSIKDTTESDISVLYLDILLNIDSNSRQTTPLYDKCDDLNFANVNFPFLCSNIPLSPAYGVYISQLIWYSRACSTYENFSKWGQLLTKMLMLQGYNEYRLKSSFWKFYVRYNDFLRYQIITSPYAEWFVSYWSFVKLSFPYCLWRSCRTVALWFDILVFDHNGQRLKYP
jgi:hypothetical protein